MKTETACELRIRAVKCQETAEKNIRRNPSYAKLCLREAAKLQAMAAKIGG
jgi:hypothetical protein